MKMSPLLLFLSAFCIAITWCMPQYGLENAEIYFEDFIKDHGKEYADENEKQARFEIFQKNLEEIIRMNEESDGVTFGITQFMDLTHEEFLDMYTGFSLNGSESDLRSTCSNAFAEDFQDVNAPESFDWREKKIVTSVKNQQKCGSCYAFSSIGNIESLYAIKHNQLLDLSEQQIVDCDRRNHGCGGGFMSNAFRGLIESGGSMGENSYPYQGRAGSCRFNPSQVQVKLADCRSFQLNSQEQLKEALYSNGPISIAISASNIKGYHGGIIPDQKCTGQVNHAVLLVGYGSENGRPYWIVKNSWGTQWGEQGFFRVQRGEGAKSCGMINTAMASAVLA